MRSIEEARARIEEIGDILYGGHWGDCCACHLDPPCGWCTDGPGLDIDGELSAELARLEQIVDVEGGLSAVASAPGIGISAPPNREPTVYVDIGEDFELSPSELRAFRAAKGE